MEFMESSDEVLCGANSYEQKYYFNEKYGAIPTSVQEELHIICVLFTEEVGGILVIYFDDEGNLEFMSQAAEYDYLYDNVGAGLLIRKIRDTRRDLLEALETFYKVKILGKPWEE